MWVDFPSTSAEITFPRAERERLIFYASFNQSPSACVFDYLSDPARSTKWSFPAQIKGLPPSGASYAHSM